MQLHHLTRALLATAVFSVVTLSGCASDAGQNGAQPSTSSARPEASQQASAAPSPRATALVIRPESVELTDSMGTTLVTVSYDAAAAEMVAALTAAIGAAPVAREHDGGLEAPPGTYYEWDGLTVSDPEPDPGTFPELTNLQLSVTAPTVGNLVSLTTVQGYQVGSETAPILVENGWTVPEFAYFHFPAEFGTELGEANGENAAYLNAWAVSMSSEPPATAITSIFAPVNFGVQGH